MPAHTVPTVDGPAIQVSDLCIRYGAAGAALAVDHLSLQADAGEVLVVLGPNGAGKTSTIEALEGYRRPLSGTLSVLGLDPRADHQALTERIGVMLQRGGVYPMLGPRQVLDLFASYYPDPLGTDHLLDLVALSSVDRTPWRRLSGGEQQRLSLTLALIGRPQVVFLDEPTAGVDPEGRQAIRAVVAELKAQGVCVLLTTHELTEAEVMADRLAIMSAGRVVREGTLEALTGGEGSNGLTFGARPGLDTASLAAALGAGAAVQEISAGRYSVCGASGPATTATLAAWLAERDATLRDLATGRSLESVYFETVGAAPVREALDSDGTGTRRRGRPRGRRQ
jgi:ABC-2 type transport system ATP-binding protein